MIMWIMQIAMGTPRKISLICEPVYLAPVIVCVLNDIDKIVSKLLNFCLEIKGVGWEWLRKMLCVLLFPFIGLNFYKGMP